MGSKRQKRRKGGKKKSAIPWIDMSTISSTGGEWVGGFVQSPFVIAFDGEEANGQMAAWFELSSGLVVGLLMDLPDEPADLGEALLSAMRKPEEGSPRRPTKVRVATPEHAASVREAVGPDMEIVIAPTPELKRVTEAMQGEEFAEDLVSG